MSFYKKLSVLEQEPFVFKGSIENNIAFDNSSRSLEGALVGFEDSLNFKRLNIFTKSLIMELIKKDWRRIEMGN